MAAIKIKRTVFILDDNDSFRESAVSLLESMNYLVEEFSRPKIAVDRLHNISGIEQAALLLNMRMPLMSGLVVHDILNKAGVGIPIIYMSSHADVSNAVNAMAKGAISFLEKPLDKRKLVKALEHAFSEPVQIKRSVKITEDEYSNTRSKLKRLTPRETQILQGLLGDKNNQEIADQFCVSKKTVELHRSRVLTKFGAKNATHLVRMVMSCAPN